MAKQVTLYTTDYCPHCRRAKGLLDQKTVSYREIDLTENPEKRRELVAQTGWQTVPMIFVGDEFIGGADALFELEAKGLLDSKLSA